MTAIRLKLFGGFEAWLPDGRPAEFSTRKAEALFAFLACRPGEFYSRDRLAATFWGDGDDRAARHSLRQALASLRRTFPAGATQFQSERGTIGLEPAAVDVDVVAFETLGRTDTAPALIAAAQLYRGPFLNGVSLRAELFEEWLERERLRLHARAVAFSLRLAEVTGDDKIAGAALQRAVELDPLCEEAHRGLMRRQIDKASYNAAIRQYASCVEVLRRELDAKPEPQTEALFRVALEARGGEAPSPSYDSTAETQSGERKHVTVLCATLLAADSLDTPGDPERTQELLRDVLEELRAIASRNCGNIIGEAGDELIAVFGAPVARENHAADACRAASEMSAVLCGRSHLQFRASFAIDSGEAVVRTRDRSLSPAGVFGDCLRRAARLARSGLPHIGATEATVSLANRFWRFAAVDAVSLDAQTPPIPLYVPLGARSDSSGLEHFPTRLLSRFIGRSDELAALGSALAPVASGRGQLIAVVGEPGIGKSRLCHEFIRSVPENWRIVVCRGDPQLADAPYLPIAKVVRACLGIAEDGASERAVDELAQAALKLDPMLERYLPALSSLLAMGRGDPAWDALEPAQKRYQIIGSAILVFAQTALRRPLLFVIEDLHWLDPASRQVLERLVEVLPAARILLIVNYRMEFVHDWGSRSFYRQIAVGPLSTSTMAEFASALLGNDVSVGSLRDRLVSSTGGNPFFIEECVRALSHSGAIAGISGAFRAERELATLVLPQTVQAVVAARIDQLVAADKALLHIAAVIGNEVPYELLRAVSDLDDATLHAALSRLQASEFLIETSVSSDPTYRFKHALTNEAAYATLLQQARRELHARILTVLEHQHAGRLDAHVEALAYHSGRGEIFEKAADYGHRAGLKSLARAAYRVAIAHFGQALNALGRLPETRARMTQEIDIRFEMRNALFVLGEHSRIMEHLELAEALAERTNDALRRGYAALHLGGCFWHDGKQDSLRAAAERALAIARETGDRELSALAWYRIGQSHHAVGKYRIAIDAFLRSTSILEAAGRVELTGFGGYPYAFCCSFLAWSFAELGQFTPAREWGRRGWRFATERNHSYTQTVMTFGFGSSYVREGCFEEARPILERGLELCGVGDVAATYSWVASPLGYTYVALGQHERGFELLNRALTSAKPNLHRARVELWLADAYLLTGCPDDASQAANRGKRLAEAYGEQAHVAWAERVLGEVAAGRDSGVAARHFARAIEIARPLELRAQLRAALVGQSRLLRADGKVAEADALWNEATSLRTAVDRPREAVSPFAE